MPRIPVYEQRTAPNSLGVTPRAQAVPVGNVGQGLATLGANLGALATDMMDQARRQTEDRAAAESANLLSKGDAYWHEQFATRSKAWKPGDPDLREGLNSDFDKWTEETASKLPTERSRQFFQRNAVAMRTRMDKQAFDLQERRVTEGIVASTEEGMAADYETIYRDPSRRAEIIARRSAAILAMDSIPVDKRGQIVRAFQSKANMSAESAELERDPTGYYQRRFEKGGTPAASGGQATGGGFEAAVARVLKHEGGYNANDGNTGAPVNFGINQKANPDIDVKNITREDAVKLYRERYWNAINGDSLPPALQATALDAAVNQGPANAKKWIEQSGGDPAKFNDLRRAHYEKLLEQPENARFRKAWMGRLDGSAAPGGVAELSSAPDSFKALPWEQRERLRIEAEGRIRQQTASAAQALTSRVQDATAMARDGIVDPQPLTRDAFAALGDKADTAWRDYQQTQVLANDVAALQQANNAELTAMASGATRRAVPGEGYAAEDARDAIRAQAATLVMRQRTDDPAGYVLRTVPAARDAMKVAVDPAATPQARAQATQRLATETIAAQRTLGISDPKVLSKAAVEDIGKRISKSQRPEDAANLVAALEAEYGTVYFPQVMNELMKAEKLTPALMIIPNLPSASARETVSALAPIKMDDLKTGINLDDQKRVREQAVEHAATLARTFPPISGSGYVLLNAYQDMIEKIAYERLRTGQDKNGAVAAESAYKMLLGHFDFEDTMRLPKGIDGSAVRKRLDRELAKAVPDSLTQADVPENLVRAYKPEESLALWRDTVQSKAVWYTNKENTGVELWARGANGELYRVKRGGQQVGYSFTDLSKPEPETARGSYTGTLMDQFGAVGAMGRSFMNNGDRPVQRGM